MRKLRSVPFAVLSALLIPLAAFAAAPAPGTSADPACAPGPGPVTFEEVTTVPSVVPHAPLSAVGLVAEDRSGISAFTECTASVTCDDGQVIQCSASAPATCQTFNSNPPSTCGSVQCGATVVTCTIYTRDVRIFPCCTSVKQKWKEQRSCNQVHWFDYGNPVCYGVCTGWDP